METKSLQEEAIDKMKENLKKWKVDVIAKLMDEEIREKTRHQDRLRNISNAIVTVENQDFIDNTRNFLNY